MKKIFIKNLDLRNFKGIKHLSIPFSEDGIVIAGANATGKTTVMDAFTWLLFGKDAQDRANFEIKTVGLKRAEYSVTAVLSVDDQEATIKRLYREKYTKRRGSAEEEFTGHETEFFINDVPYSLKEYQEYVSGLVPEQTFKLVTNPTYFNGLKKEQRREMLISFAGKISDDEIAGNDRDLKGLLHMMQTAQKSAEMFRKEFQAKRKRIEEELKHLPARIEEAQRSVDDIAIPELPENHEALLESLTQQVQQANNLYEQSNAKFTAKQKSIEEIQGKIMALKTQIIEDWQQKQLAVKQAQLQRSMQISDLKNKIAVCDQKIKNIQKDKEQGEAGLSSLRELFTTESGKVLSINQNDLKCSACGQELPDSEDKKTELVRSFNEQKATRLKTINEQGQAIKKQIESGFDAMIEAEKHAIAIYKEELDKANSFIPNVTTDAPDTENNDSIISLKEILRTLTEGNETESHANIADKLRAIEQQRDLIMQAVNNRTAMLKVSENAAKRVAELEHQFKALSSEKAAVEQQEFVIEKYRRRHDELLESKVNKHFNLVKFSLFKEQINGGVEEVCETLINGVPWLDANNAGRINAGIDICNVFAKRTGVQAPIWVDNAEAVNRVIESPSQLIKMVVTNDSQLTVLDNELWMQGAMVESETV